MADVIAHLAGGLLLGFAGGLHCACMCGGLTAASMSFFSIRSRRDGLLTVATITAGRMTAYAMLGALVGGGAALASKLMAVPAPSSVMAIFAALTLMWIGFSTAGLLPAGARNVMRVPGATGARRAHDAILNAVRGRVPSLGPFAIGLSWGFAPCPLLYAALFLAMLIGTPAGGALWMIGFGVGTLPAVLASTLGFNFLKTLNINAQGRMAVGLSIVAFGFSTVYFDFGLFAALCRTS